MTIESNHFEIDLFSVLTLADIDILAWIWGLRLEGVFYELLKVLICFALGSLLSVLDRRRDKNKNEKSCNCHKS